MLKTKQKLLPPFIIVFSLILPLVLLIGGLVIFKKNSPKLVKIEEEQVDIDNNTLAPSQLLISKDEYHKEKVNLRGRVSPEPVVCQKNDCPDNDPCCGCPDQRDLVVVDVNQFLSKSEGSLRIIDAATGRSFCQRKQLSCDYSCGSWVRGAIYDIQGTFLAQPPPPGWQLSLDYYFEVENKTFIRRFDFWESLGNLFNDIKQKVIQIKKGGSFVLL